MGLGPAVAAQPVRQAAPAGAAGLEDRADPDLPAVRPGDQPGPLTGQFGGIESGELGCQVVVAERHGQVAGQPVRRVLDHGEPSGPEGRHGVARIHPAEGGQVDPAGGGPGGGPAAVQAAASQ